MYCLTLVLTYGNNNGIRRTVRWRGDNFSVCLPVALATYVRQYGGRDLTWHDNDDGNGVAQRRAVLMMATVVLVYAAKQPSWRINDNNNLHRSFAFTSNVIIDAAAMMRRRHYSA